MSREPGREILSNVSEVAARFAANRAERQRRRHLDRADFDELRDAGFLRTALPAARGGVWAGLARSARPVGEILRKLAAGDSSVALVSAMHPAVLGFWLLPDEIPGPSSAAWNEQKEAILASVERGSWWGTITSEPGSGGDILRTKTRAARDGTGAYRLTGDKHFASGSGITSFMMTTAVPEGEDLPDVFYVDVRERPWDGTRGLRLVSEWDGLGMVATQSHAFRLEDCPASRYGAPGAVLSFIPAASTWNACLFTAVIVGILDAALDGATERMASRSQTLRGVETIEWTRARNEIWLVRQAWEGMLRAVEREDGALEAALRGKVTIAELSESALARLCRTIGGSTYSRSSPFGPWAEDVRALGFLRPPWGLAFDQLGALG